MSIIFLETKIEAPIELVFDLSRSLELHRVSAQKTNEKIVAGKSSGLIGLRETVTWRARHFGVYQNFTSVITDYHRPTYFVDEMQEGVFKNFRHEHHFSFLAGVTTMNDVVKFSSPLGGLGLMADFIFLEAYLTRFLKKRNETIKHYAESGQGEKFLLDI